MQEYLRDLLRRTIGKITEKPLFNLPTKFYCIRRLAKFFPLLLFELVFLYTVGLGLFSLFRTLTR